MKKISRLLLSRGFVATLSILVQLEFWVFVFTFFEEYQEILIGSMIFLSIFCCIHIIIKDMYQEHKIAWIIFTIMFPISAGIFYLLFGSHRVDKKTHLFHLEIQQKWKEAVETVPNIDLNLLPSPSSPRQSQYLHRIAYAPTFQNTSVKYFKLGEEMHASLLEELKLAEKFIFIESFIIEEGKMWGEIEEILIAKAKSGVDVRVLFDDLGCILKLPTNFAKRLQSHSIDCRPFHKTSHFFNANFNNRDHRKICVIDGNVGFNGGINLADEYINHISVFGHWKDTAVMLQGDAVYSLTIMFLSMWSLERKKIEEFSDFAPNIQVIGDGFVQPFADNPLDEHSVGESAYMNLLNTAENYVYITSPYLIISREMTVSLCNAAKSGIDVRLILPGIPDKKFVHFLSRSYYPTLMKAGVKIYEYTPGFIHSKMFISDDHTAVVGTINLDYRSLDLHYECATVLYGSAVVKEIVADFLDTQSKSMEITLDLVEQHGKLGFFQFVALGVLRTFSPLL
ncbi:MAG: cardiolipin synthase [Eubacteriales bacterium]